MASNGANRGLRKVKALVLALTGVPGSAAKLPWKERRYSANLFRIAVRLFFAPS